MTNPYVVKSSAGLPAANTAILELYRPVIDGMTQYGGALCDGYAELGKEWLSFINRRLHVDMSLPARLGVCGSPAELFKEWSAFMNTTAEDYRKEFARIADISSTASRVMAGIPSDGFNRSSRL